MWLVPSMWMIKHCPKVVASKKCLEFLILLSDLFALYTQLLYGFSFSYRRQEWGSLLLQLENCPERLPVSVE